MFCEVQCARKMELLKNLEESGREFGLQECDLFEIVGHCRRVPQRGIVPPEAYM